MNILFVADNRNKANWGCRATGISLSQLLGDRFTIQATIGGAVIKKRFQARHLLPSATDATLQTTLPRRIRRLYRIVENQLANPIDIITEDPRESVQRLLHYRYKIPALQRIYDQVKACDVMVINGEGDMVFTTPPRPRLLTLFMLMELAHQLGKPYYYVNGMVSDDPIKGRHERTAATATTYLTAAAAVSVRDKVSLANAQALAPAANVHFYPDALFSWIDYYTPPIDNLPKHGDFLITWPEDNRFFGTMDFSQPYICVSDSSSMLIDEDQAVDVFVTLIDDLKTLGYPIYVIAGSIMPFLPEVAQRANVPYVPHHVPIVAGGAILANARLLVSGRYHPSIFAALGGTPSVFLGSNSHKTRSLQDLLDYPDPVEFPVLPDDASRQKILARAREELAAGEDRRQAIRQAAQKNADRVRNLTDIFQQSY